MEMKAVLDAEAALDIAARVIAAHDGRTDHVQLEAEEFANAWLVYVHPCRIGLTFGGVNLVVDRADGSVRSVGSSINPNLVMSDYRRFRATTPPEQVTAGR